MVAEAEISIWSSVDVSCSTGWSSDVVSVDGSLSRASSPTSSGALSKMVSLFSPS